MRHETRQFIDLLAGMTKKELKARYKYTFLGFLWLIVNPLIQMLVIGFVFAFFIREPIEHYFLYLFTGLLVWNFFSLSVTKATPSIVYERSLIKKARFPRSVIPLSIILSNLVHFLLALILLILPALVFGTTDAFRILLILPATLLLFSFTTGLTLICSALNVKYRDVNFFIQAILMVWFYATPIIYSLNLIPRQLLWIWRANPMTAVLQLFQLSLLNQPGPGPAMLGSSILATLTVLLVGIGIFRKESKYFDDWV